MDTMRIIRFLFFIGDDSTFAEQPVEQNENQDSREASTPQLISSKTGKECFEKIIHTCGVNFSFLHLKY